MRGGLRAARGRRQEAAAGEGRASPRKLRRWRMLLPKRCACSARSGAAQRAARPAEAAPLTCTSTPVASSICLMVRPPGPMAMPTLSMGTCQPGGEARAQGLLPTAHTARRSTQGCWQRAAWLQRVAALPGHGMPTPACGGTSIAGTHWRAAGCRRLRWRPAMRGPCGAGNFSPPAACGCVARTATGHPAVAASTCGGRVKVGGGEPVVQWGVGSGEGGLEEQLLLGKAGRAPLHPAGKVSCLAGPAWAALQPAHPATLSGFPCADKRFPVAPGPLTLPSLQGCAAGPWRQPPVPAA